MYNPKDVQFAGKYDYDKDGSLADSKWNKTFSVGIFKWIMKNNGKEMKRDRVAVRVSGLTTNAEAVFAFA